MPTDERYWFPAKRYGYGGGIPRTWEGWVVLMAYLLAVVAPALLLGRGGEGVSLAAALVGTPVLLWICVKKGEPAHWRWGGWGRER